MAERKKILLVEDNLKDKVLEELDKENKLVNIKILSKNEFITNYFYDYNEETIYYVVRYYNTNPKNAKIFLDNMKYVLEIDSQDEKILFLKKLYQELTE